MPAVCRSNRTLPGADHFGGELMLGKEMERRIFKDPRSRPTPLFSRYTFRGRREALRRREDQEKGGYVDRYGPRLLFFLILIVGLNILDSFFTMIILECGGREVNPIVRTAINVYGDHFWVWKFFLVSFNVVLLCLHSRFRYVHRIIGWIALLFLGVIIYEIFLLKYHIF